MYNQEVWLRQRQRMATYYFRYAPPVFEVDGEDLTADATVKAPYPNAPTWQCSVYYYWWEFLRLHWGYDRDTEVCIPDNQVGRDFGDLDAYGGFPGWWKRVGRNLFAEPLEHSIRWADSPEGLPKSPDSVYLRIPFRCDVEQALVELRDILKPKMEAMKADTGPSGALYPVFTKPVLPALHKRLTAFKLSRFSGLTLSDVGKQLNIGPQDDSTDSRHTRTVAVSRCIREVGVIREFVSKGFFPVADRALFEAAWEKGLLREPGTRVSD